jgi:hypothetical protein
MPNRDFSTDTWTDPWFEALSPMKKLLFIYCWTNNHCAASGMYYISLKRIASESGLTEKQVLNCMEELTPKVHYDDGVGLLWVRNFIRKQRRGNRFMDGVNNSLLKIKPHAFLSLLLEEYKDYQGLDRTSIEVQENFNRSSLSVSGAVSLNKDKKTLKTSSLKRPFSLPADFGISDAVRRWAEKKGFDHLEEHLESFKDRATSKGYKYLDWDSAFRNAIREDWGKIRSKEKCGDFYTLEDAKK